jgi:hypothetical protein
MSSATKPTLYERLGGVYSIAAVVDDFIDRVVSRAGIAEHFCPTLCQPLMLLSY